MDKLRAARKAEEAQKAKRLAAAGGSAADEAEKAEPEPLVTFVDRMFCARRLLEASSCVALSTAAQQRNVCAPNVATWQGLINRLSRLLLPPPTPPRGHARQLRDM